MALVRERWTERDVEGWPVRVRKVSFPTVQDKIRFLRQIVNAYRQLQTIRALATRIVFEEYGCPPKKRALHALALADWVQRHITYVNELPETFATPLRTLRWGYGDCDDFTTLLGSLLESIGIPVEIVALRMRGASGRRGYVHVFPRAIIPGRRGVLRMPLDASLTRSVRGLPNPIRMAMERGEAVGVLAV